MSSIEAGKLFSVKGLVAVVTGGGTGIGLMIAKALEENGAKVYIVGRRLEILEKVSKEAKHGNLIPLQCDVTSKDDLLKLVDHITKVTASSMFSSQTPEFKALPSKGCSPPPLSPRSRSFSGSPRSMISRTLIVLTQAQCSTRS